MSLLNTGSAIRWRILMNEKKSNGNYEKEFYISTRCNDVCGVYGGSR